MKFLKIVLQFSFSYVLFDDFVVLKISFLDLSVAFHHVVGSLVALDDSVVSVMMMEFVASLQIVLGAEFACLDSHQVTHALHSPLKATSTVATVSEDILDAFLSFPASCGFGRFGALSNVLVCVDDDFVFLGDQWFSMSPWVVVGPVMFWDNWFPGMVF